MNSNPNSKTTNPETPTAPAALAIAGNVVIVAPQYSVGARVFDLHGVDDARMFEDCDYVDSQAAMQAAQRYAMQRAHDLGVPCRQIERPRLVVCH